VLRTVDLENTADFLPDSSTTSDLPSLITHDFVVEPVISALDSQSLNRTTHQLRTLDLAPATSESREAGASADARSAQQPQSLAPGMVLADRYLLEQVIGTGGTAVVFRARDMRSSASSAPNVQVAIKTPRPELADRPRAVARLQHEYKCMHELDHDSVVNVFDVQQDAETETWFMTMELIEGKPLSALLHNGTTLTKAVTQQVLTACADALAHAHERGIVHGDFKPANVFIGRSNNVKVLDFGAAFSPTSDSRIPAGTPAYASPEVLSGFDPEPRDDVFSFACVAYEMLTGRHPYERRSSIEARDAAAVPPRAWTLSANQWLSLLQALSLDREQRPADIRALAEVLHKEPQARPESLVSTANVPSAPAPAPLPDDILPPQRGWGFFVFVAVALVLLIIAANRNLDGDHRVVAPSAPVTPSIAAPPLPSQGGAPTNSSSTSNPTAAEVEKKSAVVRAPFNHNSQSKASAGQASATQTTESAAATLTPTENAKVTRPAFASEAGFTSSHIVTSESSIAAVFVVKRTGSLKERAVIRWNAISETAKNGEDFIAGNGGTVEFAPGQSQRAIYIPLRNDTIVEGDETFSVVITSAQRAKVGEIAKVQATIRDDD